jgi:hypothetical protein
MIRDTVGAALHSKEMATARVWTIIAIVYGKNMHSERTGTMAEI